MMNYPVAEIRGKYFPFYRFINDKANAWFRLVFLFNYLIEQCKKVAFKMLFKGKRIDCIPPRSGSGLCQVLISDT